MAPPPANPPPSGLLLEVIRDDMSAIADSRLQQLHAYWASRCREGQPPSRSEIDPIDIPRLLPFVILVDVLNEPRDYRFRLVGTHLGDFMGTEATGKLIGYVFPPAFSAEVHHHWSLCADRKEPAIGRGKLWMPERSYIEWEGILLPLAPAGLPVNMLLGGATFGPGPS